MRFVERALTKPSRCAVLPSIPGTHPAGFIDTGSELPGKGDQWDCHVYVSLVALREMNKVMGWDPEAVPTLQARIRELEHELTAEQNRNTELEAVLDSIDVLEGADFRARRKTGRPKTKREEGVPA